MNISMNERARYVSFDYDKLLIGAPLTNRSIAKWKRIRAQAQQPIKPLSKRVKREKKKKQTLAEMLSKYD